MLGALSGIRRNDGSLVEGPYTSGGVNNTSFIQRPSINSLGTKGAALGPNNPVMLPGGGSISQGEYDSLPLNPNYKTAIDPSTISSLQPINNVGIGSLTENPMNTIPESGITGSMTSSGYLNNNQDLDQYLNSYVENLINRRMRDIFGGIMSIFQ